MPIRHTVENEVTVVNLVPVTVLTDDSGAEGADFDVRTFDPGSRFLIIMSATETDAGNTGVTWVVEESATDGGSYDDATTSGSLAATGEGTGVGSIVQRVVSVLPNPAAPFVRVSCTSTANTDANVQADLVVLPRGLL